MKLARQATRARHRSNTWGAYQCYGNPDFRFRARSAPQAPARAPSLVTRAESLQALRTLASSARNMSVDDVPRLAEQFAVTFGAIQDDWREEGELLTVAAEITGELDDFAKAIDYCGKALGSKKASAPVQAAEQLANLLGRHAATTAMMTGKVDDSVREAFQRAEGWLDWLDQRLTPTGERRSVRGSLYKRMAASLPDRRLEYLAKARDSYDVGAAATAEYQSLNALAFVLADMPLRATLVGQADTFWDALPQQAPGADRDFWDVIKAPDALLHRQVLRQSLDAAALAELSASYEQAWLARPSPRQWASVTDHIWFLQAMTGDARLPCHDETTSAALKQLHDILLKRAFQPASRPQTKEGTTARGRTRTVTRTARTRRPGTSARARAQTKPPKR